jgi:hypothetical protein
MYCLGNIIPLYKLFNIDLLILRIIQHCTSVLRFYTIVVLRNDGRSYCHGDCDK